MRLIHYLQYVRYMSDLIRKIIESFLNVILK